MSKDRLARAITTPVDDENATTSLPKEQGGLSALDSAIDGLVLSSAGARARAQCLHEHAAAPRDTVRIH